MKSAVLWPTLRNHDYTQWNSTSTNIPYYRYFSQHLITCRPVVLLRHRGVLPVWLWYLFYLTRFVREPLGPICKNVRYTKPAGPLAETGSAANHTNSDTALLASPALQFMVRIIPILWNLTLWASGRFYKDTLERYNVDLIMCGHSHDYERSRLCIDTTGQKQHSKCQWSSDWFIIRHVQRHHQFLSLLWQLPTTNPGTVYVGFGGLAT